MTKPFLPPITYHKLVNLTANGEANGYFIRLMQEKASGRCRVLIPNSAGTTATYEISESELSNLKEATDNALNRIQKLWEKPPKKKYRIRVTGSEACITTRDRYVTATSLREAEKIALSEHDGWDGDLYDECEVSCRPEGFEPLAVVAHNSEEIIE